MPSRPDYTKLWEAWAGGDFGGYDPLSQKDTELDPNRIKDFYSEVVGPAWGGEDQAGAGFGDIYEQYISSFDTYDFEAAEREFKLAIGDPYTYGADPFAWERVSRMQPSQAQAQLEAELIGQGKHLGGEYGSEYDIGMSKELESFTTGLTGTRESLTYEALEGGRGLASGTSGAVLRSGESTAVAEDILTEAYKTTRDVQAGYMEGKEIIAEDLETNLNTALSTYLKAINREKEDWYNLIAGDVQRASDQDIAYDFGTTELDTETLGDKWGTEEDYEECIANNSDNPEACANIGLYARGLEYEEYTDVDTGIPDDPGTPRYESKERTWFMEDEACGIGEVRAYDEASGGYTCQVAEELDLVYDEYNKLCPSEKMDECGVCDGSGPDDGYDCDGNCIDKNICGPKDECGVIGGDSSSCDDGCGPNLPGPSGCDNTCGSTATVDECGECGGDNTACADECGVPNGDNSTCLDECGVPNGNNLTCVDDCGVPNGDNSCLDDCGYPGGPGPQFECWDGSKACTEAECPATGTDPDDETYLQCVEIFDEGWEWDDVTNTCVETGDVGWQMGSDSCHQPYNTCPPYTCCGMNGICTAAACEEEEEEEENFWDPIKNEWVSKCDPGKEPDEAGICRKPSTGVF